MIAYFRNLAYFAGLDRGTENLLRYARTLAKDDPESIREWAAKLHAELWAIERENTPNNVVKLKRRRA